MERINLWTDYDPRARQLKIWYRILAKRLQKSPRPRSNFKKKSNRNKKTNLKKTLLWKISKQKIIKKSRFRFIKNEKNRRPTNKLRITKSMANSRKKRRRTIHRNLTKSKITNKCKFQKNRIKKRAHENSRHHDRERTHLARQWII